MNRRLADGFEGYRSATNDDYDAVLKDGLVVLDTNVLLNLYRYNSQTRRDLFSVLERIGERLWIPHQVALEFWRNREAALIDFTNAAKKATDEINALRDQAIDSLHAWARRISLSKERAQGVTDKAIAAFSVVTDAVHTIMTPNELEGALDTNSDTILRKLDQLLAGKVGPPPEAKALAEWQQEAATRIANKVPPGYKDKNKDDALAAGDYLIWAQTIKEAKARSVNVALITGDVKDDWWREVHGQVRGPRVELINELRGEANVGLFMMRPDSLLVHARRAFQVEVQEASVQDVERVDEAARLAAIRRRYAQPPFQEILRRILLTADHVSLNTPNRLLLRYAAHLMAHGFKVDLWDKHQAGGLIIDARRDDKSYIICVADEDDSVSWPDTSDGPGATVVVLFHSGMESQVKTSLNANVGFPIVWPHGDSWRGNDLAIAHELAPGVPSHG